MINAFNVRLIAQIVNLNSLKMSNFHPEPWHTINVDFLGPFPTGEYLLVVTDACNRFPEVAVFQFTSAKATILMVIQLENIFATHEIPQVT